MASLETYRARIAALDFVPLSDEEVAQARAAYAEAAASARIEVVEMTPQDADFVEMLLEMRVPHKVAMPLILQYGGNVFTVLP
ncbi:MAG: hypothetical protein AABZ76_22670 [Pseudomonadota bacterium]|jgi:hypothetical protein